MGCHPQAFNKGLYIKVYDKMTVSPRDVVSFILYFVFLTTVTVGSFVKDVNVDLSFQYLVLIGGLMLVTFFALLRGTWPKFELIDFVAITLLFVWIYGFSLGIIKSNNLVGVVRNFAGLLFYLLYFFMVFSGITRSKLLKVLVNASIVYLIISLSLGASNFLNNELVEFDEHGTSSLRLYFSTGQLILIPTLFIFLTGSSPALRSDFDRLAIVKRNNLVIVGIILSLILSGGKGFYLELASLFVLFFSLSFLRFFTKGMLGYWSLFWLVTCAAIGIYFFNEIISIVLSLTTMEFDASHPRVIQSKALIEGFTWFGEGLGGTVPNYSRDPLGYGFELSYHNIVHKFGVISLFIFGSFLIPIFYSLHSIFLRPGKIYSYLPLIFMLYLLPSWGNPTIFSPVSVVLHCLALYFIRRDKLEETMNV